MSRLLVLVAFAGCSSSKPPPASPAAPPPSDTTAAANASPATVEADIPCEDVAAHIIKIGRTTGDTKPLTEMLRRRCTDDLWSLAARRCLLTSASNDEGVRCYDKLTKAQLDALQRDIDAMGGFMVKPTPQP